MTAKSDAKPEVTGQIERNAEAQISGPFRLLSDANEDITPKGRKQAAFLAVLITAREQRRSRTFLREMFWGDKDTTQGNQSLRDMVRTLHKTLNPLGGDILISDENVVGLKAGRIKIAPFSAWGSELLEGLDPKLNQSEMFDEWQQSVGIGARAMFETIGTAQSARQGIGLLPTLYAGATVEDVFKVNRLIDHLMVHLMHTTQVSVHDFREFQESLFSQPIEDGDGPSALLQATILPAESGLKFCLRLRQNDGQKVLWMSDDIAVDADSPDFVAVTSHPLLDNLMRHTSAVPPASLFPWTGIAALFSLNAGKIESTASKIEALNQTEPSPSLECLRWFVSVFRFGEGIGTAEQFDLDSYADLYENLDENDPLYGLNLSLLGYSMHMILGDNERALFLLNEAKRHAPNLALTYDHLAVVQLATDQLDAAEKSSKISCHLGRFSGLRYTYDTTRAMVALAKGDAETAAYFANKATFRKPRFLGAIRVGAASQALLGNAQEAALFAKSMARINPSFDRERWSVDLMHRYPGRYGANMFQGLKLLNDQHTEKSEE